MAPGERTCPRSGRGRAGRPGTARRQERALAAERSCGDSAAAPKPAAANQVYGRPVSPAHKSLSARCVGGCRARRSPWPRGALGRLTPGGAARNLPTRSTDPEPCHPSLGGSKYALHFHRHAAGTGGEGSATERVCSPRPDGGPATQARILGSQSVHGEAEPRKVNATFSLVQVLLDPEALDSRPHRLAGSPIPLLKCSRF